MEQANQIQGKVTDIGVAIRDSKVVYNIGKVGHEWARKQASNRQQFNSRDLMDRIREKYSCAMDGAGDINWQTLGEDAALYFAWTPGATFLCAPASAGLRVKERRARQAPQARREVVELRPQDASSQGNSEKGDVMMLCRMSQLSKLLQEKGEVSSRAHQRTGRGGGR